MLPIGTNLSNHRKRAERPIESPPPGGPDRNRTQVFHCAPLQTVTLGCQRRQGHNGSPERSLPHTTGPRTQLTPRHTWKSPSTAWPFLSKPVPPGRQGRGPPEGLATRSSQRPGTQGLCPPSTCSEVGCRLVHRLIQPEHLSIHTLTLALATQGGENLVCPRKQLPAPCPCPCQGAP